MPYKVDANGRITLIPAIVPVSLIHPERCEHDNLDKQGPDRSVGFEGYVMCEDCGMDLSDNSDFNGDHDEWDDGDRAYDSWKDDAICGIWDRD